MTGPTDNPWDLFPDHEHLATEECGNEIVCDLTPNARGAVFALWHDPPMIFVLARSRAEFVNVFGTPPADDTMTLSADVIDALQRRVTRFTDLPIRDAALAKLGPSFAAWIAALPEEARIADLRGLSPGDGFEFWGGPALRCPGELVFALLPPAKKPGVLSRIFRK